VLSVRFSISRSHLRVFVKKTWFLVVSAEALGCGFLRGWLVDGGKRVCTDVRKLSIAPLI
jgi:hypothetical protein